MAIEGIHDREPQQASERAGETFTVSGWTGGGALSGGGNGSSTAGGMVTASKNAGFTLANASLSSTDGMTLVMKGIYVGRPCRHRELGGNLFTVSGWTHAGSLTGSTGSVDMGARWRRCQERSTSRWSDAPLASTDGMSLMGLSDITIAKLGATSGGKTFTVSGWTGTGLLDGGGIGNSKATGVVTASKDAGFTLSNTSLTSTDGMTLGLNGITSANLTDSGSGGNTFTVSDWTHPGLLTGSPVVADTVAATKFANYTLTNVFLGSTDGMSLGLSGITIANLVGALPGTAFTVSGWTGSGSLISGAAGISKAQGVVTASKDAGYTLTDGSLSSTDGMSLRLKGFTTANLAATSAGETFTVSGWTGGGALSGGGNGSSTAGGMVTASKDAGFTLANASLSSTDGMTLVMKGITSADLADTGPGGNLFTVSGWTHAGSLTGSTGSVDTVEAVKNADFTLSDASLASTDGMSLGLSDITIAKLGATSGGKTFTVSGWTGTGLLDGGGIGNSKATGIVTASKDAGFTLSNTSLTSTDGMTLGLNGITSANLTDSGSGGNTFTVSDWTHPGLLTGSPVVADTVAANKFANYTLTNVFLGSTDGMSLGLSGITIANLVGALPGTAFTVSGWTGSGSLISGAAGISKRASRHGEHMDAGYTLTDGSLSSTDGMSLRLKGITTANLAATSAGETFTVSGWTGGGCLPAAAMARARRAAWSRRARMRASTLANASLSSTDGMTLVMKGITSADLADTGPGGNLFTVSGWTHAGSLTGSTSSVDTVEAVKNADFTLSDASLASTDGMSLGLSDITIAKLGATSGGKTFTVSGWTGTGLLDGGGIGNSKATGIVTASKDAGFTLSNTSRPPTA